MFDFLIGVTFFLTPISPKKFRHIHRGVFNDVTNGFSKEFLERKFINFESIFVMYDKKTI